MKKSVPAIIALIGSLLVIAFFAWAFGQHGTIGLYRINTGIAWIFNIFGGLGIVLLLAAGYLQWRKVTGRTGMVWLPVIAVVLALPAIIVPVAAFSVLGGVFSGDIGDLPPRLLMTDAVGRYGIPDIALVFNSASETADYEVTYQENASGTPEVVQDAESSGEHVFLLRDLHPETTCEFRVNDDQPYSFTTPSLDGNLHFAVGSDAHFGSSMSRNDLTAAMLAEIADPVNNYDAFFFLGDLVEYGFQQDQWQQAFNSFVTVTSAVPTVFAAGNHDTLFSGLDHYLDYCSPEAVAASGSGLWRRVDIGSAHFLILDVEWSAESVTPAQLEWLEAQLSNIPDDEWKIVMGHGFYYCSGITMYGWDWFDNPETIAKLTPLFENYGVDLVFSGHNHRLELLERSGVKYVVCGAFGGYPDPEPTHISPASLWEADGEYAFVDVTLQGDACNLVFRNAGDEILYEDSFTRR